MVHTIHLVGTYCGMLELGESVILSELQLSEPGRRPYKLARNMSKQGAHWISGSIPILFINLHHRDLDRFSASLRKCKWVGETD